MSEQGEKRSFWARLFGGSRESPREQKVLEYIVHRMNEDVRLQDVVEEEYVRRNLTESQRHDIVSNPMILEAARERMQEAFRSGELDPNRRPE
jgi:hypothetical protein